ncbi:exported hypothetical protein [Pseudoalteromonas sp. 3J6]|uniref:hypothetical protein n=1 Tax=Pseudoalteromonas sp. 3J6 TaxID=649161 RepID=UPI0017556D38|nr:hypothetical protein [Pseudoalteromonas sp. 3J6]CAD2224789.1 exported hypothetical protein [Pseudoalteromonas sp. 3J6]
MTIKQFKTALGFSLILVTFHSYATSLQNQNISKSCVSVESEKDKISRLQRGEERVDIFVGLNSFTAYDEGFKQKIKSVPVKEIMPYSFTSIGIIAASMQTVFPVLQLALCNEEYAINNKCNYERNIHGGRLTSMETVWKSDTKYTMTQYVTNAATGTKRIKLIVSSELPNYWNGNMTMFNEDGSKAEVSWSRSDDGTEYYQGRSLGGTDISSITFTEYPNCSAEVKYVKNEVKITANWILVDEKTTGNFLYCNQKGCHNGDW